MDQRGADFVDFPVDQEDAGIDLFFKISGEPGRKPALLVLAAQVQDAVDELTQGGTVCCCFK